MMNLYYNELIRCKKVKIRTLESQIGIIKELKRLDNENNESYHDLITLDYINCLKIEYNKNVKHLLMVNEWIENTTKDLLNEEA